MELVTIQETGDYCGFTIQDGSKDAKMIGHVSRRVEAFCGIPDFSSSERTEYHDGGRSMLYLKHWPVTAISAIYEDVDHVWSSDTLLDSDDYYISSNHLGVIFAESGRFGAGFENVKIVYTAGYAVGGVPEMLKTAVLMQLQYELQKVRAARTDDSADLLPEVRAILRTYRREIPFG